MTKFDYRHLLVYRTHNKAVTQVFKHIKLVSNITTLSISYVGRTEKNRWSDFVVSNLLDIATTALHISGMPLTKVSIISRVTIRDQVFTISSIEAILVVSTFGH